MWNLMSTTGHTGPLLAPFKGQKRNFGFHLLNVPDVYLSSTKAFTNPNFVNSNYPHVHNYQDDYTKDSHIDSNSSSKITELLKENDVNNEKSSANNIQISTETAGMEMENVDIEMTLGVSPKSSVDFVIPNDDDFEIDDNFCTIRPPSNLRQRQLSVADSEDSFIVFKSDTDDELLFSDDSEDELDSSETEDDCDSSSSVVPCKRVRFADDYDLCEIHPMVQWAYAYQQARKGPWEEYARDRDRFKKRIDETAKIILPILDVKHRENIYKERFRDSPN